MQIKAGEELEYESIIFRSKNNGGNVKHHKNLPQLEIIEKK